MPVLIVARKKWHRVRPVLATLDLASNTAAKRALNRKGAGYGQTAGGGPGVELEIITAIEVPVLLADLDLVDPVTYAREAEAAMAPRSPSWRRPVISPPVHFRCKRGPVERVIASRAAKVGAQIVVMGTVGRKGSRPACSAIQPKRYCAT